MKRTINCTLILNTLALSILLFSCSKKDDQSSNSIAGTWKYDGYVATYNSAGTTNKIEATCNSGSTINFNNDNSCNIKVTGGSAITSFGGTVSIPALSSNGKYEYNGGNTMQFNSDGGGTLTCPILIHTKNELSWKVTTTQSNIIGETIYKVSR